MELNKLAIGIRTFLRDDHLFNAIDGIRTTMPDARIIVADCGEMTEAKDSLYAELGRQGHKIVLMDFDAGFGAMSNAIVDNLDRDFLLIGSDDFDFHPPKVRRDIEEMILVLENNSEIGIASGRVNGIPYEFNLIDNGDEVLEVPIRRENQPLLWFQRADLTVNYSLIRKSVFKVVRWYPDIKICGGEHGSFYISCKRAGVKTVIVNGVNINEQKLPSSDRYKEFRRRGGAERPAFDKIGVKRYVLGNGVVDYDVKEKK